MSSFPWILIVIAVAIIVIGVIFALLLKSRKDKAPPTDYYTFFVMGIIWVAFGIIFWDTMIFFFILGLAFMAIGLANKDKWKQNHRTLKDMKGKERKFLIWIMIILGILVLVGFIVYYLIARGII